jgi:hypothetical protein
MFSEESTPSKAFDMDKRRLATFDSDKHCQHSRSLEHKELGNMGRGARSLVFYFRGSKEMKIVYF